MSQYIAALDQGTTSSRCILFNQKGEVCSCAQREFRQIFPKGGWVEHDPMEIWASQIGVLVEAMGAAGLHADDLAAIGITNQRETTIVWEKATGRPVCNAIVWQCRRTAPMIEKLKQDGWAERIRKCTGLVPDAYFSASKLAWILNKVPHARERAQKGELLFGTVDTWLIWNLTQGRVHVTDYTNASVFAGTRTFSNISIFRFACCLRSSPPAVFTAIPQIRCWVVKFPLQALRATSRRHYSASAVLRRAASKTPTAPDALC